MKADKPADGDTWRRMHGLWVLERTRSPGRRARWRRRRRTRRWASAFTPSTCWRSGRSGRLASARLALAGLKDADPNVQRAAADALGRHPATENLRPLLDLRHAVPAEDTHLLHVVRMALRDQLLEAAVWQSIPLKDWTEARCPRHRRRFAWGAHAGGRGLPAQAPGAVPGSPRLPRQRGPSRRPLRRSGSGQGGRGLRPRPASRTTSVCKFDLFKAVRNGMQERGEQARRRRPRLG